MTTLWKIDPGKLLLGDILLERGPGLKAAIISMADKGKFSHAAIWVGGDFIEAVSEGARVISFARFIINNPTDWLLLRLINNSGAAQTAALHARNLAHKKYNVVGAVSTKLPLQPNPNTERLFCSQLIAEAYLEAGIDLLGLDPHKITPNMLLKSTLLMQVELPLIEISDANEKASVSEFVDREKRFAGTPMSKEMAISQEVFNVMRPLINSSMTLKAQQPGNLSEILDALQSCEEAECTGIADTLLSELEKREYFDLLIEPFTHIFIEMEQYKRGAPIDANTLNLYRKALPHWENTALRYQQNFQQCMEIFTRKKQKLWLRLAAMYRINFEGLGHIITSANELMDRSSHGEKI